MARHQIACFLGVMRLDSRSLHLRELSEGSSSGSVNNISLRGKVLPSVGDGIKISGL